MFKKIKFLFKDDRGQSLIMVALMMIVLLGVTALTVDYGFLAWQRRSLQNAADAGALAAAWELPDGDVVEKAKIYVDQQEKLVKTVLIKLLKSIMKELFK